MIILIAQKRESTIINLAQRYSEQPISKLLYESLALFLILLFCHQLTLAQGLRSTEISYESIGVSFDLPNGFSALSKGDVDSIYKRYKAAPDSVNTPKFFFGDKTRDAMLAINIVGDNAREDELSKIKDFLEKHTEKTYQKVQWLDRNWITINNNKWVHLSFKHTPADEEIVSDIYLTVWFGKIVFFAFTVPVVEYTKMQKSFDKCAKTIILSVLLNAPTKPPKSSNKNKLQNNFGGN